MANTDDQTEACYKVEYELRGKILDLEHQNGRHRRQIESMRSIIDDLLQKEARLAYRIGDLGEELNVRNIPLMRESLKSSAQLALAQDDEITKLKAELSRSENLFKYVRGEIIRSSTVKGDDLGLCDLSCWCEWMDLKLSQEENAMIEFCKGLILQCQAEDIDGLKSLISDGTIEIIDLRQELTKEVMG